MPRPKAHPGVSFKRRTLKNGQDSWRARWLDPDTGKEVRYTLDLTVLPTKELRRDWAIRKSKALAKRRMELEGGASMRPQGAQLTAAVDEYLQDARNRLRPNTVAIYETAIGKFQLFCSGEGITSTAQLTRSHLVALKAHLIESPKQSVAQGGRRGQRAATAVRRSPTSVNYELRALKTLLNTWRIAGHLKLDSDAIADTLKSLPLDQDPPRYLKPAQIRKLLEAAIKHDNAVFTETRDEHAGLREIGTTTKHIPIAPFVAYLLLTGCRRGEALGVEWSMLDLEALDHDGNTVGEIQIPASLSKTRRGRIIGLEVSPLLLNLLQAMQQAAADNTRVFAHHTLDLVEATRKRLITNYGAPPVDWKLLRSTCDTYLTNAQGIFGAASVFMASKQMGHSVTVAEKHYLGVIRGIPRDARTLESAMRIEDLVKPLMAVASGSD